MARGVVERGVNIGGCPGKDKGVQIFESSGQLVGRKLDRHGNGLAFGSGDGGQVILELVRNLVGFFV